MFDCKIFVNFLQQKRAGLTASLRPVVKFCNPSFVKCFINPFALLLVNFFRFLYSLFSLVRPAGILFTLNFLQV